ncbi:hypothetical protein BT96DRAFT_922051 [Gymnopus androsaceus JB14]|uniref:Uncharacterized protein n=1 Tax=Gymnopus androsaceus JB14 TaxID=1447944 RepID=A0A6A4HDY5_9AGAR|nr:hypothetical protein BT96DRAFT_922051 [Gymnopus androsaceus JB14]
MASTSYYYPQYTAGPTRNHHHQQQQQHRDASSGRKHSAPFYQSTNHHSYHAIPTLKRVAPSTPVFESSLPKTKPTFVDASLMGHMPSGFPFRHTLDLNGKGKAKVSYEPYDIRLTAPEFGPREHVGIVFKGPSSQETMMHGSSSSSRYFTWQVYASAGESRSHHTKASFRSILAQVRVDPAVMHSTYGHFLRSNPEVISRALSISLELGVLLTICIADPDSNAYLGSSKLIKSVMNHRKRTSSTATREQSLWDYWCLTNGLGVPYGSLGLANPVAGDDILYIGTSNHGCVDILYTCPNAYA